MGLANVDQAESARSLVPEYLEEDGLAMVPVKAHLSHSLPLERRQTQVWMVPVKAHLWLMVGNKIAPVS